MPLPNLSQIFSFGKDILSTVVDAVSGTILAQIGDVGAQYSDAGNCEWWQHVGYASRPPLPVGGKSAAQCISIRGSRDAIIASRDTRSNAIYGNLGDGETCVYAAGKDGNAQARVVLKADGSITMMTTDTNTGPDAGGQVVMLRVSPQGGFQFTSQWGSMVLDQTGFHVKTAAGPRIDMGGVNFPGLSSVPGISSVANSISAYATITAPIVRCAGSSVFLGMGPVYGTAVNAQPALIVDKPPLPLSLADLLSSSIFSSQTVWISP